MTGDEALVALAETSARFAQLANMTFDLFRARLDELETRIADLDDATPSRRAFEELHSRVDELERLAYQAQVRTLRGDAS